MKRIFFVLTVLYLSLQGVAMAENKSSPDTKNVLGTALQPHGQELNAGFYRDGFCNTGPSDAGQHVIAATVTEEFLNFTKSHGNDLQTPRPDLGFPGLKPGNRWCLCAARWAEAEKAGVAPPVDLGATHAKALETIPLETLRKYSIE